jgi:hypothetical protein
VSRATLKDGAGTTYDLTFIGEPTVDTETETCTFNFTFQQAPTDLPVYVVELEGTNGRITKTRTGLEAAGWLLKINATDPRMVDE